MYIKEKKNREQRIDQQEWLVLQIALHIEKLMEIQGVSRSELAKRLGSSKGYVTQLLDGANMSLRKVADVMMALDSSLKIDTCNIGFETTVIPEERGYLEEKTSRSWTSGLYYNTSQNITANAQSSQQSSYRLAV